jgi:c-di-GMP-binding flagellar brake protein YcgR
VEDRRQLPRIRLRRKVHLQCPSGRIIEVWTRDLSHAGLQVLSASCPGERDEFVLRMAVPDEDGTYTQLETRVRVAHCVYEGTSGQFRVGFQFLSFSGEGERLYRHYVDQQLHRRYESRAHHSMLLR